MIWGLILAYIAIIIITELLRPKPDLEDAKAAKFTDFGLPTTDPSHVIPVGWGTFRISGPGVVWYGDYAPYAITKEVKTGLWSKEDVIEGYLYFIGIQLGICRALDSVIAIDWDDNRLATFAPLVPTAGGTVATINEPDFLGGKEGAGVNGGGITGDFRFYKGEPTQTINAYLTQFQDPISAYRQLAYCVLEHVNVGSRPTIAPIAFICNRLPNRLWSPVELTYWKITQNNGTITANPMEVVYELLTDDDYGLGLPSSVVNLSNFREVGEVLYSETHGYANAWYSQSAVGDVISDIFRQIDGTLFLDFDTGLLTAKLVRAPTSASPGYLVLNEDNVVDVENFTRGNWSDTSNRVVINWNDPFLTTKPSPALQDDMANQLIQNRNVVATFNYLGVSDPLLAAQIAARDIRGLAFPLATCTLVANRDAFYLRPGDVFELQWDDLGIKSMRMRIASISIGGSKEIRMRISCAQDVYSLGAVAYAPPAASGWSNPLIQAPAATLADACFEAPLFMDRLGPLTSPVVADTEQNSRIVLAPVPAQSNITGFRMMESGAGGSPNTALNLVGDFGDMCASAFLAAPIAQDQFLNPSSPDTILVNNGTLMSYLTSATATQIEDQLANLMLIDDEFFSFEGKTINGDGSVTLTGIHRAKLDTVPAAHSISPAPRVFFLARGVEFGGGITTTRWSNAGKVSARPNTSKGILSAAAANQCSFPSTTHRVFRPYRPANLRVEMPLSPHVTISYLPTTLPSGLWRFHWNNRSRTTLSDADVDALVSDTLETNTEVVIQFRSATLSPQLRREVTFTGSETYDYTEAFQNADFGGAGSPGVSPAQQEVIVRVFSRRTAAPLDGLESHSAWEWTITRTGVV